MSSEPKGPDRQLASSSYQQREALLNRILLQQPVDLEALYTISRLEGGFLTRELRGRIWPKLLGINRYNVPDYRGFLKPHRDFNQVGCDIDRSLWNYPETNLWSEEFREKRRNALSSMILSILCRHSELHYFQGYHDVMSVFLLTIEDDHLACALGEAASLRFFRDCMNSDFDVVSKTMRLIMVILKVVDQRLYSYLTKAGVEPFFATSWIITWFAHDIKSVSGIARIYDALLCSHPLFSLYLCATLLIHCREEIFRCPCDFASLHNCIVHLFDGPGFPFEELLPVTDELMTLFTPTRLKALAAEELQRKVDSQGIQVFKRPKLARFVDADWFLLRNMRCRRIDTNGYDYGGTNSSARRDGAPAVYAWGWQRAIAPWAPESKQKRKRRKQAGKKMLMQGTRKMEGGEEDSSSNHNEVPASMHTENISNKAKEASMKERETQIPAVEGIGDDASAFITPTKAKKRIEDIDSVLEAAVRVTPKRGSPVVHMVMKYAFRNAVDIVRYEKTPEGGIEIVKAKDFVDVQCVDGTASVVETSVGEAGGGTDLDSTPAAPSNQSNPSEGADLDNAEKSLTKPQGDDGGGAHIPVADTLSLSAQATPQPAASEVVEPTGLAVTLSGSATVNTKAAFTSSIYCGVVDKYPTLAEARNMPDVTIDSPDANVYRDSTDDTWEVEGSADELQMDKVPVPLLYKLFFGSWALVVVGGVAVLIRVMLDSKGHEKGVWQDS